MYPTCPKNCLTKDKLLLTRFFYCEKVFSETLTELWGNLGAGKLLNKLSKTISPDIPKWPPFTYYIFFLAGVARGAEN